MPRLPRLRITLRFLFLLVAIIAGVLGWHVKRHRDVRSAIETIQAKGGRVFYRHEMRENSSVPAATSWFRQFTGEAAFDDVDAIALTNEGFTDEDIALVRLLPSVTQLVISDSRITDDGLREIATLPNLVVLDASHTDVTATGLSHLEDCTTLRNLYVSQRNAFRLIGTLSGVSVTIVR